jgi:hypothetical protein
MVEVGRVFGFWEGGRCGGHEGEELERREVRRLGQGDLL